MNRTWLVAHIATSDPFSGAIDGFNNDEWRVFEFEADARAFYDDCVDAGAYSVTLCAVVRSTDYEPHEFFRKDN
jgi:hypothetical protein